MSEATREPADAGLDEDDLPEGLDPDYTKVMRRPDVFLSRTDDGLRLMGYYRPRYGRWVIRKGCTVRGETVVSTRHTVKLDAGGPDGDVPQYEPAMQRYLWKRTAGYTGGEPLVLRLVLTILNAIMAAWYTLAGRRFRFQRYRAENYTPDTTDDDTYV